MGTLSTTNYTIGGCSIYFNGIVGHGNLESTDFNTELNNLGNIVIADINLENAYAEHFKSLNGRQVKDKSLAISSSVTIPFVVDETTSSNINKFLKGSLSGSEITVMSPLITNSGTLIIDESMEYTDTTYWQTNSATAILSKSSGSKHGGTYSLSCIAGVGDTEVYIKNTYSASISDLVLIPVSANEIFYFDAYIKNSDSHVVKLNVIYYEGGFSPPSRNTIATITTPSGDWEQLSGTFTVPADVSSSGFIVIELEFENNSDIATCLFDDINFYRLVGDSFGSAKLVVTTAVGRSITYTIPKCKIVSDGSWEMKKDSWHELPLKIEVFKYLNNDNLNPTINAAWLAAPYGKITVS